MKASWLDWPAKSPDLNPLENVWGLVKNKVASRYPETLKELDTLVKGAWEETCTPECCSKLYGSLPQRVQDVLDKCGARTVW